ncbi:hypothetical protein [Synechococcus sp. EJ6-Ellesmere]|uniref:hypothetical protein n=1 Tax=Synechococcus sp. EJ6-Ellesmere TaxID=2823734 RepID=UPI0020CCFC24|nr:hypothetical protein [Synechococcus sp. EJ6-Ellesmere]MCP9825321.1 hypothetical protein [Synechococcus sp. EJ6-Ellesmere]
MAGNDPSAAQSRKPSSDAAAAASDQGKTAGGRRSASAGKRRSSSPFDRERFIFQLLAVVILTQLMLYTLATGVCGNVAYNRRQQVADVCPRVLDQVTASFDATMKLLVALLGGAALERGSRP